MENPTANIAAASRLKDSFRLLFKNATAWYIFKTRQHHYAAPAIGAIH